MNPSFQSQAPGFDEPIEMLKACHERIERQLSTLERLLPHLAAHGCDEQARQAAVNILRYFNEAGPHHHADEEQDLFPALLDAAEGDDAERTNVLVAVLLAEHREMNRMWAELRPWLAAIATGESVQLGRDRVAEFCALYRRHILTEEGQALTLAEQLIAPETLAEVGAAMAERRGVKPAVGAGWRGQGESR